MLDYGSVMNGLDSDKQSNGLVETPAVYPQREARA